MSKLKLFIANRQYPKAGLDLLKEKFSVTISRFSDAEPENKDEIRNGVKGMHGLLWCTKYKLDQELLDLAGPQLKVVTTMSSGLDQIDIEQVRSRGIKLGHTLKVLDGAVADIAVGLVIAAARRFKEGLIEIEKDEWKYGAQWTLGQDIEDSIVGIIGLGGIGQAIVKRLKGFDVKKFIYCGRTEKPEAKTLGVEYAPLETLLRESNYIILCCPYTTETRHMINASAFSKMRRNATIINIARGDIIDQNALVEALKTNRIWAAGLDVATPEPLPSSHPLVSLPNCFLIPHLGSATFQTRNRMAILAANNLLLAFEGKQMQCPAF